MCSVYTIGCFIVTYFLSHVDFTIAVTSWNMHDLCGANKNIYRTAGELRFDSNELPVNLPGSTCKLTLTSSSATQNMMVMFYFTQFKFYDSCDEANVNFIDGISNNDRVVPGLPRFVCGNNSTLEQPEIYFTTSGEHIKISYNKGQPKYRNTFTMMFVTYHLDYCYSDTDHECSNGNCIPEDYACLDSINSCGSIDTNCAYNTTTSTPALTDDIVLAFQGIGVVLFFITAAAMIFCFFKRSGAVGRHCSRVIDCIGNVCDCFRECARGICHGIGKCFHGISMGCTVCGNCLRTRCSDCRHRVTRSCADCRRRIATSNNETDDTAVGNVVTSQPQSEMSTLQSPPSYEMAVQQRYQPEVPHYEASNDSSRATPSAPPRNIFHSVEDEPPSYEDVMSKEAKTR